MLLLWDESAKGIIAYRINGITVQLVVEILSLFEISGANYQYILLIFNESARLKSYLLRDCAQRNEHQKASITTGDTGNVPHYGWLTMQISVLH